MKSKYPTLTRDPGVNAAGQGTDTMLVLTGMDSVDTIQKALPYLQSHVDHDGGDTPGVRVYKCGPESMSVQIRTFGPVGEYRNGKSRRVHSCFSSNRQNMLKLAAEIKRIAEELPEA
jgi:hypothetical protein